MAALQKQRTKDYGATDALSQANQDPLNLHEYMMSETRTPRIESLMRPSPSPSIASGSSPQLLSAYPEYPMSVPHTFMNPFDSAQTSSPNTSASSFLPLNVQTHMVPDGHIVRNQLQAQRHSVGSGTDTSPQGDAVDHITTPESAQGYSGACAMGNMGMEVSGVSAQGADKENSSTRSQKDYEKDKSDQPPPWSEMRTKAGKERKRLPLACIACRRKKIRCSGEKPACKHCLRSRIPCVYKVTTRKAAPRTDYMAMLDKRLKRMEERVIKLIPKESQPAVPRAVVKPSLPTLATKITGKKRVAEEAFGPDPDLEKWAKSRHSSKSGEAAPIKGQDPEEGGLLTEGTNALPSKELQQHLAEVYFDFVYGQSYPLLHKPSFMRRLAAGNVAPVLVLAVCAVSARFSNHPEVRTEPAFLRGEDWASAAREIALKRYDTPNITILIVYLILGLHEFGTCQGGRSWMLAGMAQRMAFALLLHKDLDHNGWGRDKKEQSQLSPTDREIRRRTMWACFLMDRFNASGTDRPMQMSEDFVNIPLPIKEHYFQMELSAPTETLSGKVLHPVEPDTGQMSNAKENMGTSAYYIRLVAVWGRMVRYWNLGGREKENHPIWSTQSKFHSLRESVRKFYNELPDSMRWNPENLQNHVSERNANQFVFLHLVYYQLTLFLHRWSLPFSGFSRPPKDMPQAFHTEAARIALEAANQVSSLIKEAIDYNVTAPFAGYCAFYSSTVHIHGVFSKNAKLEAAAKQNLAYNVKYLSKMKKYWGMFHFVAENLKELYRQHADAALRGPGAGNKQGQILQYGDWFDRYPHGVSQTDYEDPAAGTKNEPGTDAVLGQKSDLQSVEEFFATLSPPSKAAELRKQAKKAKAAAKKAAQKNAQGENTKPGDTTNSTHMQQPHLGHLTIPQDHLSDQIENPYLANTLLTNFNSTDLSLLNNTNPLVQPGMLSQLDRHLVLSSYAGMDPTSAASITNTMGSTQLLGSENSMTPANQHGFSTAANNIGGMQDLWNMDFGNMNTINGSFGGMTAADASTAWFMPFNLDPPEVGAEDGFGAAAGMMMGQGGYEFGFLGNGMVIDSDVGGGGEGGGQRRQGH